MKATWKINNSGEVLTAIVTSGFDRFVYQIEVDKKMTFLGWDKP
jgi:hypothetical protein